MNTKHTPGPWTVGRTITGSEEMVTLRGESGSGEKIYDAMIESPECFIAGVGGRGRENCVANARLIAAAPDLLEACQHLLEMVAALHADNMVPTKTEWPAEQARAAIAKATDSIKADAPVLLKSLLYRISLQGRR